MTTETGTNPLPTPTRRREAVRMETPEDVTTMLRLHKAGWGAKRIAEELGCARNTVRRYLRAGAWVPYAGGRRAGALDDHRQWVERAFEQHEGNAAVVRQELETHRGVHVSLRTVERAVAEKRRLRRAATVATVRFETPPGKQLQADFGERTVRIGGEPVKVHFCVLTLAWSRRCFVRAFPSERQENWLITLEGSFHHFGGVPEEILVDNARALVKHHDVETREVTFSDRFRAFSAYWGFRPRACAPYRPRTKGKDERGVAYVKRNAIAGREFESWEALHSWLDVWTREIADVRVHGTTGEQPMARFDAVERHKLRPLRARVPFLSIREVDRKVHYDATIEIDTNAYTVPWSLIGCEVTVRVQDRRLTVLYAGEVVARHDVAEGRRRRVVSDAHWAGLTSPAPEPQTTEISPASVPEFLRSLDVYAAIADGRAA